MRAQLSGISISLMVHGMAAIMIFWMGQGLTPPAKTVVLDFSLDCGGGLATAGPGEGGDSEYDEKRSRSKALLPEISPGGQENQSPMNKESSTLSRACPPPPLATGKRPRGSAESPPLLEKERPVAGKSSATHRNVKENPPEILKNRTLPKHIMPKTVQRKKTVEPVHEQKITPDQPIEASPRQAAGNLHRMDENRFPVRAHFPGSNLSTLPAAGPGRLAESRMNTGKSVPERFSDGTGPGSRDAPAINHAGSGGTPRGIGENLYLKAHFNSIRSRLRESLCYPSIARKRGWHGKVLVAFTVYPDGRADSIEIQKSCGISLLDKSALKTVENACPFPAPPMKARVIVPILYRLE